MDFLYCGLSGAFVLSLGLTACDRPETAQGPAAGVSTANDPGAGLLDARWAASALSMLMARLTAARALDTAGVATTPPADATVGLPRRG